MDDVYDRIRAERERAHVKHGETSMESAGCVDPIRLAILVEEVGEVARALNEYRHEAGDTEAIAEQLDSELIQVAAMAAAWSAALNGEALR